MIKMLVLICIAGGSPDRCTVGDAHWAAVGPAYSDIRLCRDHAARFEQDQEVKRYALRVASSANVRILCVQPNGLVALHASIEKAIS